MLALRISNVRCKYLASLAFSRQICFQNNLIRDFTAALQRGGNVFFFFQHDLTLKSKSGEQKR